MKNLQVAIGGILIPARILPAPKDGSATEYTFGNPYRRVRADRFGLYAIDNGQRVPVAVVMQ